MVTKALILTYYKYNIKTIVEIGLSDYISSGVFFQLGNDELLHSITFFFKNFNPIEYNYKIYDKELLAIIRCFKQWRPKLEGIEMPIKVITNHKNLKYFITTKKLTRRQTH